MLPRGDCQVLLAGVFRDTAAETGHTHATNCEINVLGPVTSACVDAAVPLFSVWSRRRCFSFCWLASPCSARPSALYPCVCLSVCLSCVACACFAVTELRPCTCIAPRCAASPSSISLPPPFFFSFCCFCGLVSSSFLVCFVAHAL